MDELEEQDLWIGVWCFSGQLMKERDGEPEKRYLNIFPGDKLFSLWEDKDWIYGHLARDKKSRGLVAKTFVRPVLARDEITNKTKTIIRDLYQIRKDVWLEGKEVTTKDFKLDQDFHDKLHELEDLLKERINLSERVPTHWMDENRREISEVVNEMAANKNYNLMVDTRLDTLLTHSTPLTRLFDQQGSSRPVNPGQREVRSEQPPICHLVSLSSFKTIDEKVEEGEINFTMGVYSKIYNGFITDFFSMTDMRNNVKTQKKKKFVLDKNFRDNPDLYLIVMVMLIDPNKANKCKAIGMMKLDQFLKETTIRIITHTSKDYTVGVMDQIQRIINERERIESHEFKFKIKEIKEGSQDAADFLFMKGNVPALSEKKRGAINKVFLTIETGKFTGAHKIFAETFNISLDVELLDQTGQPVKRMRTSQDKELSSLYKAITCPDNNKCEWREVIQIDLSESDAWQNYHVKLNIYKQSDRAAPRKSYGMSFIKFAMEDGTFITDESHKLYVFQIHRGYSGASSEDYLDTPYEFDSDIKTLDKKELKNLSTAKFSLLPNNYIYLKTKLVSTEITNDKNIHAILRIPEENFNEVRLLQIISNYNREDNNIHQRILFLTDILDSLWNVLENSKDDDHGDESHQLSIEVFKAFVQTVHPLIINKREFGYATEYLDHYIETEFTCRAVFYEFIKAFTALIQNVGSEDSELTKYAIMSMKIAFKFIIKSFNLKVIQSSADEEDKEKFSSLVQEIGKFLLKKIKVKNIFSKAFKAFFDIENVRQLVSLVSAGSILKILQDIVSQDTESDSIKFNTITEIVNSELFMVTGATELIFNIGKSFILATVSDAKTLNDRTKDNVLNLIKTLYERTKTTDIDNQSKRKFYEQLLVELLPVIVKLCSSAAIQINRSDSSVSAEILLVSLLAELSEESFSKLSQIQKFPDILDKLLKILQNFTESSVVQSKGYKMRIMVTNGMISLFRRIITELRTLTRDYTAVVETFFSTVCSLITFQHDLLQEQTAKTRTDIMEEFGDISKILTQLLSSALASLDHDNIYKLVTFEPEKVKIMDSLFLTSVSVRGECQKDLLKFLLKFMESEYFGTDLTGQMSHNMMVSFTWLIVRIVQLITAGSNTFQFTNHKFMQVFKECVQEEYQDFSIAGMDKKDVERFKNKIQIAGSLIEKILTTTLDSIKADEHFKEHRNNFTQVTAKYNLLTSLQKTESVAIKEELLDPEDTMLKKHCIQLLMDIYKLHENIGGADEEENSEKNSEKDPISAGFTLKAFSELIPWKNDQADPKLQLRQFVDRLNDGKENEGADQKSTAYAYYRNEIQKISIDKFKEASGFECSVEMMEDSIKSFKSDIFDYKLLANAHKRLAEIFEYQEDFVRKVKDHDEESRKNMERARGDILNPQYYLIRFSSVPELNWLRFLSGKAFVYRGESTMKPPDLMEKIRRWFPKVQIVKAEKDKKKSYTFDDLTIELNKLDAIFMKGSEFQGKNVPPQVLEYPLNNVTQVFVLRKMFEKVRNKENPTASTFANNSVFVTASCLPGMVRWAEVVHEVQMIETSPLENCLSMLQEKNMELELTWRKLEHDPTSVNMALLGQSLNGVILAMVGGGIPMIEKAFLGPDYLEENPEDAELIEKLKDEIRRQIKIEENLLPIHNQYKKPAFQALHDVMVEKFQQSKREVESKYNLTTTEGFRDNVLNTIFLEKAKDYLEMMKKSHVGL